MLYSIHIYTIIYDLGLSDQKLLIKLSIDANEKDKTYFEHLCDECIRCTKKF